MVGSQNVSILLFECLNFDHPHVVTNIVRGDISDLGRLYMRLASRCAGTFKKIHHVFIVDKTCMKLRIENYPGNTPKSVLKMPEE